MVCTVCILLNMEIDRVQELSLLSESRWLVLVLVLNSWKLKTKCKECGLQISLATDNNKESLS